MPFAAASPAVSDSNTAVVDRTSGQRLHASGSPWFGSALKKPRSHGKLWPAAHHAPVGHGAQADFFVAPLSSMYVPGSHGTAVGLPSAQ